MTVQLASARVVFHMDVNVGDPVVPRPRSVLLPRLRGGVLSLLGYPLTMVHAEKIVTMTERGEANTRRRDFADVYLLTNRHGVNGDELAVAMVAVANHRNAALQPLLPELNGFPQLAQHKWAPWVRKQRLDDRLPQSFERVLLTVAAFADPVLTGNAAGLDWDPHGQRWRP